jgi:SAM-dependent MidA family methyltransferase
MKSTLPAPDEDALRHSERLKARIEVEIERSGGWISFDRFMEMALYEPGLGYYSAGARKLGADGDFVTAPEISPLFSRCVASQCADVLKELGNGDILEFGAGSGVMAADILTELSSRDALPTRYLILEVSADLRERQQQTIRERAPALLDRVVWLDALPTDFVGVMLANEVLDAIPVARFHMRGSQINVLGVTSHLDQMEISEVRADADLLKAVRAIEESTSTKLPDGYLSEINLRLPAWIEAISAALKRGVVLLIDYGLPRAQYYNEDRSSGTLLCHYRHRFHNDPLIYLGLQDIGAWVDFTAVAEAAVDAGLQVAGFCTQAHFLIGNHIDALLAELGQRDLPDRLQLARQTMVLTLPNEMGERFKVLGLTRDFDTPLAGFSVRDLAASL